MHRVIGWFGGAAIICAFIVAFLAYFIIRFDPLTGITYDGFGRPLVESPWLFRDIFGVSHLWAGLIWFVVDMIVFWGCVGLGMKFCRWGFKNK